MKDKHIHISEHSELLQSIYRKVEEEVDFNDNVFRIKLLLKFLFYFSCTLVCYYFIYNTSNAFLFTLAFVLYGFSALLFAFNFSHDFSHNTIFRSKRLNNFCFVAIYTLVGAHAEAWKQRHINSHHHAPNVAEYDSDLKITKLIRVIPDSEYMWFHKYQHIYAPFAYMSYSLFWIFVKDVVILFSKDEFTSKKGFRYHLTFWMQKSIYIVFMLVMPLMFSLQNWKVVLIAFFLMHFTQSVFLLFTFFMTHHVEATSYPTTDKSGNITTSWLMNQVKSSNDMHPFSNIANFLLGGFNNHIAHHLFPHLHHFYYLQVNRILYSELTKVNIIPNQTSYFGGVISHLRLLKSRGKV